MSYRLGLPVIPALLQPRKPEGRLALFCGLGVNGRLSPALRKVGQAVLCLCLEWRARDFYRGRMTAPFVACLGEIGRHTVQILLKSL